MRFTAATYATYSYSAEAGGAATPSSSCSSKPLEILPKAALYTTACLQ
eukprot:CAMPEP_0119203150 /NCGR_PEP_ID=MMETSP1316-20130426/33926_1 /TAXON_ID=41880 /ORGANISM="Pycnococcus provasolii, Strain RCC2336" /LENGTH=47 /DNA_ID= /DNA_START= /DNA_END= /DNA_ORIENTATION=